MEEKVRNAFNTIRALLNAPERIMQLSTAAWIIAGTCAMILILVFVCYVLYSHGLQKLSAQRCLRGGWLAWLPFGRLWVLGNIADDYYFAVKGRVRARRKLLLCLSAVVLLLTAALSFCSACRFAYQYQWFAIEYRNAMQMEAAAKVLLAADVTAGLVLLIYKCMALHDVYASSEPDRTAAYLVVGMLLPFTVPFFVYSCRKKEYGMPIRKPALEIPVTWQPKK